MLAEFFAWWAQQLRDLLAGAGARAPRARALVIAPSGPGAVTVSLRRRGQERALGRLTPGSEGVAGLRAMLARARPPATVLRLPPDALLERAVTLPLAAERDLARVLGYEMDRLTPFRADEVFFSASVAGRDRARGQLRARLFLVPRAAVAPLLALLREAGAPPPELEATDETGALRPIPLRTASAPSGRRLAAAFGVLCAALALAAIAVPFARQSVASAAIERRIATLRPRVDEAEALRRRIANAATRGGALAAQQAQAGDVLAVLAAVTGRLPDNTFLTAFTLHQGRLALRGQSRAAAPLIASLAADQRIRNPSFAAPVTRAADGHADLFSITAGVAR
jgi:general secretion pathway protein L